VPTPGYLVVVGLDGRGQVSSYAPVDGPPIHVTMPGEHLLDGSAILDGALGPERVVAVLCPTASQAALAVEAARAALKQAGGTVAAVARLPIDCPQVQAFYVKAPR
jgi:hypothetical protein